MGRLANWGHLIKKSRTCKHFQQNYNKTLDETIKLN